MEIDWSKWDSGRYYLLGQLIDTIDGREPVVKCEIITDLLDQMDAIERVHRHPSNLIDGA